MTAYLSAAAHASFLEEVRRRSHLRVFFWSVSVGPVCSKQASIESLLKLACTVVVGVVQFIGLATQVRVRDAFLLPPPPVVVVTQPPADGGTPAYHL